MHLLKKGVHLFVFSNVYIACCAVIMTLQTKQLLSLSYDSSHYLWFVFFSTLCSYNFHWYIMPVAPSEQIRARWTRHNRTLHALLFATGLAGAVWYYSYFTQHWFWMLSVALVTFLYSAPKLSYRPFVYLRKVAIGKTLFLAFVWMHVTTLLPAIISHNPLTVTGTWLCVNRFSFIYAICILFDYRDRTSDRQQGIRSMITYFGEAGINRLFYLSLAIFFTGTAAIWYIERDMVFACSSLLSGALLWWLYPIARRNFSDYLYYIVLDGLMMLSALIQLISYF
ncbi:MAG: hypothetical protein H7Y03_10725 [Chitinophagaceae bacterium]|nr:hypothetical protein [Chitinophagaceae bacterium]